MASKEDNRSRIVIVHGLPQDATVDIIRKGFEDLLHKAGYTDKFDVVYPIHECRGITVADPNRPVAALIFSDHIPAEHLCEAKVADLIVQPLQNQVFLQVSATIGKHFWDCFPRKDEAFDILARLQTSCAVNVKHEQNGDVVIGGFSFQIAIAEEVLTKVYQEVLLRPPAANEPMETNDVQHQRNNNTNAEDMRSLTLGASSTKHNRTPREQPPLNERHSMTSMDHFAAAGNATTSIPGVSGAFDVQDQGNNGTNADDRRNLTLDTSSTKHNHTPREQPPLNERYSMTSMGLSAAAGNATTSIPVSGAFENGVPAGVHMHSSSFTNQTIPTPTTGQETDTGPDIGEYFNKDNTLNVRSPDASRHLRSIQAARPLPINGTTRSTSSENGDGHTTKGESMTTVHNDTQPSADQERMDETDQQWQTNSSRTTSPSYDGSARPQASRDVQNKDEKETKKPSSQRHNYRSAEGISASMSACSLQPSPQNIPFGATIYKSVDSDHVVLIYNTDITKVTVDAIVNAANSALDHSAGAVSRAIAKAAGINMELDCKEIRRRQRYLVETDVVVTTGGSLCDKIMHAVAPISRSYNGPTYPSVASVYSTSNDSIRRSLETTIFKCLDMAEKMKMRSIAIPAIGSGTLRLPEAFVANAIYEAVVRFCAAFGSIGTLREIHLVDIDSQQTFETNQCFQRSQDFAPPSEGVRSTMTSGGNRMMSSHQVPSASMSQPQDGSNSGARPKSQHQDSPSSSRNPNEEEKDECPICLDTLVASKEKSLKCGHKFCKECIDKSLKIKNACPVCGAIFGKIIGNQPKDGKMTHRLDTYASLTGYEYCGTIVINYFFPSGTQTREHPNPGKWYDGISRTAYLPDNIEGRAVLQLLQKAFKARLTFTIGQSVTTGRRDQLTWNDIHHKTNKHGGVGSFGYPDSTYLTRVKDELAAKGIK